MIKDEIFLVIGYTKQEVNTKGETTLAQLFFHYGAMNSGKSIEILKVAHNYEEQHKSVVLMTSGIDTRENV